MTTASDADNAVPQNPAVTIETEPPRSSPLLPEVSDPTDAPLSMNTTETPPEIRPVWGLRSDMGPESQRDMPRPAHEPQPHTHAFHRVDSHRCGNSQHPEPASCSRVCIL